MQITTELVTFLITIIVIVAGAWWRVESAVKSAKTEVQQSIQSAKVEIEKDVEKAAGRADAAGAMVNLLSSQLADHKLHVAETYITKAGLREFRDEVMTGVRDIKGSVSTLHERMDRFIEPNARRTKPPSRE